MTAIPAVPSEPPLTDEAALSDAELASLVELEAAATPAPWGFANGMIARGLEATGPGSYTCIQSVAEMTDVEDRMDWDAGPAYADVDPEDDAEFIVALRNAWPRLVASLRSARKELEAARVVTTLYAWTGGGQETERELALFQAWHEYVITYGTPNPSDEWDQRIADLAARRRARQAEVRAGLAKIVTTEEGASRG